MRTPITLKEFLFTLNQDEDIFIHLIDYEKDERICSCWKSDFSYRSIDNHNKYKIYKGWLVQYFIAMQDGLEITIVESETKLD